MAEYIEQGYTEPNYTEGDIVVTETSNCDLTSLQTDFNQIDASLITLDDKVDYLISQFSTLIVDLNTLKNKSLTLATKTDIATLSHVTLADINLPSLNGRGCEHLDGAMVTVLGRSDIVYTVERSFVSLYMDNGYTVHYDLIATSGHKVTVPEALLTKYIQTEV